MSKGLKKELNDVKIELSDKLMETEQMPNRNPELKNNDLCPNLSMKHKIILFILLNILGYCLQIGGITKLFSQFYNNDYKKHAILYTVGK